PAVDHYPRTVCLVRLRARSAPRSFLAAMLPRCRRTACLVRLRARSAPRSFLAAMLPRCRRTACLVRLRGARMPSSLVASVDDEGPLLLGGGPPDRPDDRRVPGAPAHLARDRLTNLVVGRIGVAVEQGACGHQHSRRA